jgi:hypothetical protein
VSGPRATGAAALLAVGVAVAGCGGSSKPSRPAAAHPSSPAPIAAVSAAVGSGGQHGHRRATRKATLSAPSFTATADQICRSYRQQVAPLGQATTLTAQERVYASVVGDAKAAIARLRSLSPPGADAAEFSTFIHNTARAVNDFTAAQSRTRSTEESVGVRTEAQDFADFQGAAKAATAAHTAARSLGLRVCGSAGSDWL